MTSLTKDLSFSSSIANKLDNFSLTIAVPTYNRLQDLEYCLSSIECSFKIALKKYRDLNIELIVSNNNSPDGTKYFLENYQSNFSNLHFRSWTNDTNVGATDNLKILLREATSRYILILTDDDMLLPYSLVRFIEVLKIKTPSFLKCSIIVNQVVSKRSYIYGKSDFKHGTDSIFLTDHLPCLRFSHVFSGCILQNDPETFNLISRSSNCYPPMQICAMSSGNPYFLEEALILHQHQNAEYWELDVDISSPIKRSQDLKRNSLEAFSLILTRKFSIREAKILSFYMINAYNIFPKVLRKQLFFDR